MVKMIPKYVWHCSLTCSEHESIPNNLEDYKQKYCSRSWLDHKRWCTWQCIRLSRFWYISGIATIAIMLQVWFLPFKQYFPLSGALYVTHYHVAGVLKGEVYIAILMQLGVGWVDLVMTAGIRGFHGGGTGGRGVWVGGILLVAVTLLLSLLLWRQRVVLGPGEMVL